MRRPASSAKLTPFRALRNGAALGAFCAVSLLGAAPAHAQVRLHGEAGNYTVSVMSWRDIPFRTVVRQQYDYSCGSAAVATLLRYHYGTQVAETEVFQAMFARGDQERIRQVGFSMLDMRAYLQSRGFAAEGLRLSLDRLASLNVPAIALITHAGYRHFVVVKGIDAEHVLVGDPTFGLQAYTRAEFEAVWNGVVLAVRTPPEGAAAPGFNRDEEWRPWASAPLQDAGRPVSPSDLLREMPEVYQITRITDATP